MEQTDSCMLKRSMLVLDAIRKASSETIPGQQIMAFLYVATHEGCSVKDIATYLRMSPATASRTTAALSTRNAVTKKNGYGLIHMEYDKIERRRKRLTLSEKGQQLVKLITQPSPSAANEPL